MSGPHKPGRRAKPLIIQDDCDAAPPDQANPFSFKEFVRSKSRSKPCDGEMPQNVGPNSPLDPDGNRLDFISDYQETFFKDPTVADDFLDDEEDDEDDDWSGSYQPSVIEQTHDADISQESMSDHAYRFYASDPFPTWLPNGGTSPPSRTDPPNISVTSFPEDLPLHALQLNNQELQQENNLLRSAIQELKERNKSQAERVKDLQRRLEEKIVEEQKEAQDLESMVQQVEANLQMMTKKASKAESHVTKLKQEVALLQVQLSTYRAENEALRRGETAGMNAVKQNANLALESLHKAVSGAQASIKQLVSGADALHLVAELLKSIDKIAEVHEDVP